MPTTRDSPITPTGLTMRKLLLPVLALFLVTGCGTKDDPAISDVVETESSAATATEAENKDLTRPDALNPVNAPGEYPLGWQVRLDRPNPEVVIGADTSGTDVRFVNMTPGWHFETKAPRVILHHPASTAVGAYSISSQIYLFDPGNRTEAYGLLFGGHNLTADNQEYLYFVIRRTGEYLVKQRIGDETAVIQNWTEHDAIVPYDESTNGTAENILGVTVGAENMTFFANGVELLSVAKGDYQTDGLVGFRFNHGVQAHITSLDVEMASSVE